MELRDLLLKSKEITPEAVLTPLTGGVSSDICLVEDRGEKWVAKRALEKLKVSADWHADVSRYISEYRYMQTVGPWVPGAVPKVRSVGDGYFTMEFLGDGFENWKQLLLAGNAAPHWGTKAGEIMGTIHSSSWKNPEIQKDFETTENFEALRIESYLRFTGKNHPSLQTQFHDEAERIKSTRLALVHGDFSPKNILLRENRMVLLDCEVAWFGEPAFDAAFLTNHFVLKSLLHPTRRTEFLLLLNSFWNGYFSAIGKDRGAEIQKRATHLQWMLLLARVDGKSPAEYLNNDHKQLIREKVHQSLTPAFSPSPEETFERLFQ